MIRIDLVVLKMVPSKMTTPNADDMAVLSHTQQQVQEKTNIVAEHSARQGLNIHRGKSKILKVNSTSRASVTLGVVVIEEVDHFTYLGSVVDTPVGTDAEDGLVTLSASQSTSLHDMP